MKINIVYVIEEWRGFTSWKPIQADVSFEVAKAKLEFYKSSKIHNRCRIRKYYAMI